MRIRLQQRLDTEGGKNHIGTPAHTSNIQLLQNLSRTLSGRKLIVFSYRYNTVCFQYFES